MSPTTALPAHSRRARRWAHVARLLGTAALAIVLGAAAAHAQDDVSPDAERFERRGILGAGYVIAFDDFETLENSVGNTSAGQGFSIWLGYRFNAWVATIARGEYVRGLETNFNGNDTDTELASGTLGARVYPLASISERWDDRIEPYAEVTVGLGNVDRDLGSNLEAKETNFVSRFALGFDVWITESVGLTFSSAYWLPAGDLSDFRYYSGNAGVQYRF